MFLAISSATLAPIATSRFTEASIPNSFFLRAEAGSVQPQTSRPNSKKRICRNAVFSMAEHGSIPLSFSVLSVLHAGLRESDTREELLASETCAANVFIWRRALIQLFQRNFIEIRFY